MRDRKIELNQSIVILFMFLCVMWYRVVCLARLLLKRCERRKRVNNKWVEGTSNPDLLEDCLPVNQFQLYHVNYVCV